MQEVKSALSTYSLLGQTGLRVSPIGLGTMTFGWDLEKAEAEVITNRYLELGGNFIDTADAYSNGMSEAWLGEFLADKARRDQVVLATKISFGMQAGNPNSGGNGRKNIRRAVEDSLRRLGTDRIDLYWLHAWDQITPAEEVVRTLNDLVREGKILHFGLSDVPAWYAARVHTLSKQQFGEPVAALQLEYSLISRNLEREHRPMATELGIAIQPWSPLGSGLLTGKYRMENGKLVGQGRIQEVKDSGNPVLEKFAKEPRHWQVLETLLDVAKRNDVAPAKVALRWVMRQRQVIGTLIGATSVEQLESNLDAINLELPEQDWELLEQVSRPQRTELDHFGSPEILGWINAGTNVSKSDPHHCCCRG